MASASSDETAHMLRWSGGVLVRIAARRFASARSGSERETWSALLVEGRPLCHGGSVRYRRMRSTEASAPAVRSEIAPTIVRGYYGPFLHKSSRARAI